MSCVAPMLHDAPGPASVELQQSSRKPYDTTPRDDQQIRETRQRQLLFLLGRRSGSRSYGRRQGNRMSLAALSRAEPAVALCLVELAISALGIPQTARAVRNLENGIDDAMTSSTYVIDCVVTPTPVRCPFTSAHTGPPLDPNAARPVNPQVDG